jgi:hypothetical protein
MYLEIRKRARCFALKLNYHKQRMYNVTLRRVRVITAAVGKQ